MGEMIKKIGSIKIKNNEYGIELNGPVDTNNGGIIHIQSDSIRVELSQKDFYRMVGSINLARENLMMIKRVDLDE